MTLYVPLYRVELSLLRVRLYIRSLSKRDRTRGNALLLLVSILLLACPSPSSSSPQVVIHPQSGDPIHILVKIADTQEKRQLGLMYRNQLPEFSGMLFIFPQEIPLNFWMKNTPLPLDIIYINTDFSIVHIAENTMPYSTVQIPSKHPAKYVLEVNAGFCRQRGIVAGDRVEFFQVASKLR